MVLLFDIVHSKCNRHNHPAFIPTPINVTSNDAFKRPAFAIGTDARQKFSNTDALVHVSTWYGATLLYNIYNKQALNIVKLPNTIAAMQMCIGIPGILYNWVFNPGFRPRLTSKQQVIQGKVPINTFKNSPSASILKQGAFNALSHGLSVYALSQGSPAMVHTIKSLEPLFTSTISYFSLGTKLPIGSYLSLIPIVAGVGLASYGGADISKKAIYATLAANLFSSLKNIEAKKFYANDISGQNLTPSNVHTLVSLSSLLFLVPLSLSEYSSMDPLFRMASKYNKTELFNFLKYVTLSGIAYNVYNRVSFLTLTALGPITHAVANTFKRIFIIASSALLIDKKFSQNTAIGSALAVLGTLGYSLAKNLS